MRPTREQTLMTTAHIWAERSTCSRAHVGCVVEFDGRILTTGYNGAPAGMEHCDHTCTCTGYRNAEENRPHAGICPTVTPCKLAVHAEANAIAFAARYGIPLGGARLITTMAPCYACCQLIINAGVSTVLFDDAYRDMSGVELLELAGVEATMTR